MTAFDPRSPSMRLWHRLLAGGATEDEATALMNGYAHELAERLICDEKAGVAVYRPGLMWAAEVIDPQPDDEESSSA